MKIIKRGKNPAATEKETTCQYCQTVFSYNKSDVLFDLSEGDFVECPVCHKTLSADAKFDQ